MNIRRRAALFAAVFATGLMGSAFAASAETLGDAITSAYETNPDIRISRANMRNADESYFRARRQNLFPSLSLNATTSGNRSVQSNTVCTNFDQVSNTCLATASATSSSQSAGANLSVGQQIYGGGRLTTSIKNAEISLLQSRETLRNAEASLVTQVVQVYLDVLRAQESLEIQKNSLVAQQQTTDQARARYEEGVSTRTDLANTEAQLASVQAGLSQAEANLENARLAYRNVVGRAPEDLQPPPPIETLMPKTPGEALQVAKANNSQMRNVYLNERSAAIAVASARTARRPTINTSVGLAYTPNAFQRDENFGLTGSVNLSWPIFPNTSTSSQIRSAEESYRIAEVNIERQQRSLQQSINTAWNQIQSQRNQMEAQELRVRSARLATEGTREELAVSLRTQLELLQAENSLRDAEQSLVTAKYANYQTSVNLLNTMGVLDATTLAPQIEEYDPLPHFENLNDFELPWDGVLRAIDRVGAPAIPERIPGPDEVVPTFDENF